MTHARSDDPLVPEPPASSVRSSGGIRVPETLLESWSETGDADDEWIATVPDLVAGCLRRWNLTPDGPPTHGIVALVLPVVRADGGLAVLKVQPVTDETEAEPIALRAWRGDGAVRLLEHDPDSGTMLLERLDAARPLSEVPDALAALRTLCGLLGRLTAVRAPSGLRTLGEIAAEMLDTVPEALPLLHDHDERRLLDTCAGAVRELSAEPGDRLLHWDLHYDNVLAAEREPWLAIDPKPLAGDPCFELLPALVNRWDDVVASGDVTRAVRRRFDLAVETLGFDRQRAVGWTLGRILQNALWDVEDGETELAPEQVAVARALLGSRA